MIFFSKRYLETEMLDVLIEAEVSLFLVLLSGQS